MDLAKMGPQNVNVEIILNAIFEFLMKFQKMYT